MHRAQITGHLVVEQRSNYRVWIANFADVAGIKRRKTLGPAWAKESGRRTARGAPMWRAADGVKPDGYLTPKEAEAELADLLAQQRAKPSPQRVRERRTFGDAVDDWLRYVEHDRQRSPSTMRGYRSMAQVHLLAEFGAHTPLRSITKERTERYRERLLGEDKLSRETIRKILTMLHGVLKRAKQRGWIAVNPAVDVEKVTPAAASGDFNVLEPAQIEAVARAAEQLEPARDDENRQQRADREARNLHRAMMGPLIRVAAYTGLRLGELRALRWRDVNFADGVLHVRHNAPVSAPAGSVVKAPKSGKVRSVPLTDQAAVALDGLSDREFFAGPDDLVFASPLGGHLDDVRARKAFYLALEAAGLGHLRDQAEPITFHDLRHTFGTLAVRAFPVPHVQAMMGHADIGTTMRYVHHQPRHDDARRLTAVFAADETPAEVTAAASD